MSTAAKKLLDKGAHEEHSAFMNNYNAQQERINIAALVEAFFDKYPNHQMIDRWNAVKSKLSIRN